MGSTLPQTTLCLLVRDNQILLAMKKRGFGMGKWNGYGGKLLPGESLEQAALREMEEEIGVRADPAHLDHVAKLRFYFKTTKEWDQEVNVYLIRTWNNEPGESEEMQPAWFDLADIPFESMWPDDKYWLPKVLEGKKLVADFYFTEDGNDFEKFTITEVENLISF